MTSTKSCRYASRADKARRFVKQCNRIRIAMQKSQRGGANEGGTPKTKCASLKQKDRFKTPREDAVLLIKQCDKRGIAVPDAQRRCSEKGGAPCHLATCPRCRRRLAKSTSRSVIKRYSEKGELQWGTITPAAGRVEFDEAAEFDVKRFQEFVRRKLWEALPKGTEIFGALDVSANLHENSDRHLQFHYHVFVWPPLDRAAREKCSQQFKRGRKKASKPVVFNTIDGDSAKDRVKYTFKWFHQRRPSFDPVRHDDGITVRPKPKKQSLQAKERIVIHAALQGYVIADLLLLMGVKRIRCADPFSVELMKPKGDDK